MTPKHTPGPWRVETWHYSNPDRDVLTVQTDKDAIAQVLDLWCPTDREEERIANARLIAEAPAMRERIETLMHILDNPYPGEMAVSRELSITRALLARIDGK